VTRQKVRQLSLNVRLFNVRADGLWEVKIQATSAAAAKYEYFKLAREAGYVRPGSYLSRFRDFLDRGIKAVELHR